MRKRLISAGAVTTGLVLWMVMAAGGQVEALQTRMWAQPANASADEQVEVVVYKSPSCGCCTSWVEHLRNHDLLVTVHGTQELAAVKDTRGVPSSLRSCHTALIEGYVIEGHVPADVIRRLIEERPSIAGLAVPGMPMGSPGMEMPGREPQPYNVVAWTADGATSVYAER